MARSGASDLRERPGIVLECTHQLLDPLVRWAERVPTDLTALHARTRPSLAVPPQGVFRVRELAWRHGCIRMAPGVVGSGSPSPARPRPGPLRSSSHYLTDLQMSLAARSKVDRSNAWAM